MIVPIPGKYKNYSQKSDNSDVATPSISSTEVDNTASSHNSIQPRVVESHEFAYYSHFKWDVVRTAQYLQKLKRKSKHLARVLYSSGLYFILGRFSQTPSPGAGRCRTPCNWNGAKASSWGWRETPSDGDQQSHKSPHQQLRKRPRCEQQPEHRRPSTHRVYASSTYLQAHTL